jgi:hypothetical protein
MDFGHLCIFEEIPLILNFIKQNLTWQKMQKAAAEKNHIKINLHQRNIRCIKLKEIKLSGREVVLDAELVFF